MANFVYTVAKSELLKGTIDFDAPNDFRVRMHMTNTTVDTEEDVATLSAFTTMDECDGTNYAEKLLGTDAVSKDDTNNRGEYDAADITWTALGAGTRNNQNLTMLKWVTATSDSPPLSYYDTGGFPFNGNGGDVTVQWNAEGIFQAT